MGLRRAQVSLKFLGFKLYPKHPENNNSLQAVNEGNPVLHPDPLPFSSSKTVLPWDEPFG